MKPRYFDRERDIKKGFDRRGRESKRPGSGGVLAANGQPHLSIPILFLA
jgi:hypothetical protein